MSTEKIREASQVLEAATDDVGGDTADRLRTQADALADLADRDRGPDHGRIARHQQQLNGLAADDPAAAEAVERANDLLNGYRETIEGV